MEKWKSWNLENKGKSVRRFFASLTRCLEEFDSGA